jgi:glycosyltransferase involved in cell wall biosynthesis
LGRNDVVFVAGRDPRDEISGGHSAYVRSYARAALLAGFVPHLFCAARDSRVEPEDFGVVHRVASPVRPFRQLAAGGHAPWLTRGIVAFARGQDRAAGAAGGEGAQPPLLIHGFGVWGSIGVAAAARLRRLGRRAVAVVSSYTTYEEEARAQLRAAAAYGPGRRAMAAVKHLWIRLAVERWERRGYLGAERVLINYESVRRLVAAKYGDTARCHKLPYTCEAAFATAAAAGGGAADGAVDGPAPGSSAGPATGLAPLAALDPGLPALAALDPGSAPLAALQPGPAPLVVGVARHETRKGIDVLLHALARLRADGVPFRACLLGGGPLLATHRQLVSRLGLDGTVAVPGAVREVVPWLARADVFVLASREEQSGSLALLEALRQGLAVVASGVDGIPEDVSDGDDALLVPPGDSRALAAALARVLGDAELRRRLGRRGRETFAARFSPAVVAASLAQLYASLGIEARAAAPAPAGPSTAARDERA